MKIEKQINLKKNYKKTWFWQMLKGEISGKKQHRLKKTKKKTWIKKIL
jgi:hypothetical protein